MRGSGSIGHETCPFKAPSSRPLHRRLNLARIMERAKVALDKTYKWCAHSSFAFELQTDCSQEGLDETPNPAFRYSDAAEPRTPCHLSPLTAEDNERTPQGVPTFDHGTFSHSTFVPNITFQPATPSEGRGLSPQPFASSSKRSESIPSSPTSMSVDHLASPSQNWRSVSQKRRPLISMGPRAGCEKCEKKVPGHWMHFD